MLGRVLAMQTNSLTGTIPASFSVLAKLQQLALSGNALSGTVPSSYAALRQLTYADWNERCRGMLCVQVHCPLELVGSCAVLCGDARYLGLSSNQLTGTSLSFLQPLTSLQYVH